MFFISYIGLASSKSSIYVKRLFQLFSLCHDQENTPAESEESTETVFDNQTIRLLTIITKVALIGTKPLEVVRRNVSSFRIH